jgi:hypothetical protein
LNSNGRPIFSTPATYSRKRKTFASPKAPLDSHTDSQDIPPSSTQENWFEALEIIAQKGNKYEVSWAGIDPSTGKQWKPTWVYLPIYEADFRSGKRIAVQVLSILGKGNEPAGSSEGNFDSLGQKLMVWIDFSESLGYQIRLDQTRKV